MSHEIDFSNGRANMAYVGEMPWHGLGHELPPNADIETWRIAAGLDWKIDSSPVVYNAYTRHAGRLPRETQETFDERHVLYRSDTGAPLSIVSDRYKIVQPGEVLEFYRSLVESANFQLETAGSLFGGRRIWALARTGDRARIMGQDEISGYLLLATSCDGSLATTAKFTSVRTVCHNTLSIAVNENDSGVRVPHSRKFNAAVVQSQLIGVHGAWADFVDTVVEPLAQRRVSQKEAQQWLIHTFGDPEKSAEEQSESDAKIMRAVWGSVVRSPGSDLRSADGTAWGLVNGATHYVDYMKRARTADKRFSNAQFGVGETLKRRAVKQALKLVA